MDLFKKCPSTLIKLTELLWAALQRTDAVVGLLSRPQIHQMKRSNGKVRLIKYHPEVLTGLAVHRVAVARRCRALARAGDAARARVRVTARPIVHDRAICVAPRTVERAAGHEAGILQ